MAKEELWERRKGETEVAYEAFVLYRDMGLKRKVTAVAEKLSKSRQLMTRWKARWDWDERARAYDNHLELERLNVAKRNVQEMEERHISIAMKLQAKALRALSKMNIDEMTPKDIKEFIKMSADLERMNRLDVAQLTKDGTSKDVKNGTSSLADTIVAAYKRRMEEES